MTTKSPFDWRSNTAPSVMANDPDAKATSNGLTLSQRRSLAVKKFEREHGYNPGTIRNLSPKTSGKRGRNAGK